MALKIRTTLFLLLFAANLLASSSLDLFFTDKYETNFFSSTDINNTELHIGSDLFRFIEKENLHLFGSFIDSFLKAENVIFNQNVAFNNNNTLVIQLEDFNALKASKLSEAWFENYNIEWIKLLKSQINLDLEKENESELIILKKIYKHEEFRPFHANNIVNKTALAFVIPKEQSIYDFDVSKIHINTKRYTSNESDFNYTEISLNNELNNNELVFNFPSYHKNTFLKNSISMHIIKKLLTKDKKLDISYSIAQSFIKIIYQKESNYLKNFKLEINEKDFTAIEFETYLNNAIDEILDEISLDNLFFYSYFDKLKLEQLRIQYQKDDLYNELKKLDDKSNFLIEVNQTNSLYIDSIKLDKVNFKSFSEGISFKPNAVEFVNENDSLLVEKLNLFLAINKNYNLSIISTSKSSEYLFISKSKKDEILNKYNKIDYNISHSKNLKLYRSLIIFNQLVELGVDPRRLNCIGLSKNYTKVNFEFFLPN